MHRKTKYSISKQFSRIFVLLMFGTILLCWFLNNTFLEDFYINNKKNDLLTMYDSLNNAANDDVLITDEYGITLQNLCSRYNVDVLVLDVDSQMVRFAGSDLESTRLQLLDYLFLTPGKQGGEGKVIADTNEYRISIVSDKRLKNENIEMWGTLDNGNLFLVRSALESIRDSVHISNRFLAYVGGIAALISGCIIWFMSKKMTKPILELADISERMARLDFNAHYEGKDKNEIAVLGENINSMSYSLQSTISELKTANNQLMMDIEKKNQIDDMRKEFISNVSHELKTPIAIIQGYAEGLQEGISDDAESRAYYCNVICDEAAKMNAIVQKLLTLNQLEFGQTVVELQRFDLVTLIKNVLDNSQILLEQNNISLYMEETEPIYVWADEYKIEEVIANYLSNAIHHCSGEKKIEISFEKRGNIIRTLCFNSGELIPEESIPHLWDKFYKVDKARTRQYGGSGIGLSIVKAIMDSIHQKYGVENKEDGVVFWFELESQQMIEDKTE